MLMTSDSVIWLFRGVSKNISDVKKRENEENDINNFYNDVKFLYSEIKQQKTDARYTESWKSDIKKEAYKRIRGKAPHKQKVRKSYIAFLLEKRLKMKTENWCFHQSSYTSP